MILVALLTAEVIKVVTLDLLIQVVCQGSSPLSGLATALFGPANWVTDLIEVILCTLMATVHIDVPFNEPHKKIPQQSKKDAVTCGNTQFYWHIISGRWR